MYYEKIENILKDIENKELEIAGGSVVGINLSITNSLIIYIANLTIGKKNYQDVQDKVIEILEEAKILKTQSLKSIDKDKEVLENILLGYKNRKESPEEYQKICKEAVDFALEVIELAYKTLNLSCQISKVGNKMLSSDFKICKYYAEASVNASKENLYINLNSIDDEEYKKQINENYENIIKKYEQK